MVDWAAQDDNVRAVVLTGSAAADSQHPLSDRDIEIHASNTRSLEGDDSWWTDLGEVLAVERLRNGEGQPTRLIYYVGGKLDFTLVGIAEDRGRYVRPFRILLDKDGAAADWTVVPTIPEIPDQAMFDECCNWAAAAALMAAKAIVRDEPWSEMTRDADLRAELLRMIEWDHNSRYGASRDVRYLGTRMRLWMDCDVQRRLEGCASVFGGDNREALLATLDLFDDVAMAVTQGTGIAPFDLRRIREEITHILGFPSHHQLS